MSHKTNPAHVITDPASVQARLCSCGVVHVGVGPVALNLSTPALRGMVSLLSHLITELDSRTPQIVNTLEGAPRNVVRLVPNG